MNQPFTGNSIVCQCSSEPAAPLAVCAVGYADMVPELDSAIATKTQTILLVEDEAFVREVAVQVLRSAGYGVLTARNAAEARRLYDQFSSEIDLLLSDVILPDENGQALAWKLRSDNIRLRVLFVTGYADQAERITTELGNVECLLKPFPARILLQKVRGMLDTKWWTPGWCPVRRACGS